MMSFRNCFYLSVAAHILIFGSAIAFAQYGRGMFLFEPRAVSVSLVSLRQGTGLTDCPVRSQSKGVLNVPSRTVATREVSPQKDASEISTDLGAVSSVSPVDRESSERTGVDEGSQGDASADPVNGGTGVAGSIAPEQWAAIASAIERAKNYPRLARERGIEGVVRLRFLLKPSGAIEKIEVLESSGSDLLDYASIGAVSRAAPMPYVNGWVEVPIAYVLK
jgi:TonB family protein